MGQELVKEWSFGYIIEHWTRVLSIVILVFTGFYIHWPFMAGGPDSFIMAWMRFFHFLAAYALLLGLVVRIYMAFRSTFDADWKDFSIMGNLVNVPDILMWYLFLKKDHKKYRKYNPLQAYAYLGVACLMVLAALTGFAIYHGKIFLMVDSQAAFGWVNHLMGSESYTRIAHILIMWCFIVFLFIHVYLSVMNSLVKRDESFTSIFTGNKLPVDH